MSWMLVTGLSPTLEAVTLHIQNNPKDPSVIKINGNNFDVETLKVAIETIERSQR